MRHGPPVRAATATAERHPVDSESAVIVMHLLHRDHRTGVEVPARAGTSTKDFDKRAAAEERAPHA
jgi:hypothetical protein